MTLTVLRTISETREFIASARGRGKCVGLVPTMGALHDGHSALATAALERAETVIASVFVNPTQFNEAEDLSRYPRTPDADAARLDSLGVAAMFMPDAAEMYPEGPTATTVTAGPLGEVLEGASRPGHYDGVLTVVAKLLSIVAPDIAAFGEKDAQQLFLVRQMVRDLNTPVEIVAVPTVREPDGLALSSRNSLLQPSEREDALALSRALAAAEAAAASGVDAMRRAARETLAAAPGVRPDYAEVVDPATFQPAPADHRGPAQVLLAARVGNVRLIDNATFSAG